MVVASLERPITFKIFHSTQLPAADGVTNYDRMVVGIGEQVDFCIADFKDPDAGHLDGDEIGRVKWEVSNPNVATLSAPEGTSISVYFTKQRADYSVTITATVDDKGKYGDDTPKKKSIIFQAVTPKKQETLCDLGIWPPYAGYFLSGKEKSTGNYIGSSHFFRLRTLPVTVNFSNLHFRENLYVQQSRLFPNTTYSVLSQDPPPVEYNLSTDTEGKYPIPCLSGDLVGLPAAISKDALLSGGSYGNATIKFKIPQDFQTENGDWQQFWENEQIHQFYPYGGCVILENGVSGTPDGPWEI